MKDLSVHYLEDSILQFRRLKDLAEGALAQLSDEEFRSIPGEGSNSLAVIVKHMAGNMRSRWTDFLTTDGEKPDRNRDTEFEVQDEEPREPLMDRWDAAWRILFETLTSLTPADLQSTVNIRGEPHSVVEAVNRQMTHYAYHVGQIVSLAKILRGRDWKPLSIPKGESREFNKAMRKKFSDF